MDEKMEKAMSVSKGGTQSADSWWKTILESTPVQEISLVVDAKQYRQCNKKMKNALDEVQPNARRALESVENLSK